MDDRETVLRHGVTQGWASTRSGCAWVVGAKDGEALPWVMDRFTSVIAFERRIQYFDALADRREARQARGERDTFAILPIGFAEALGVDKDGTPHAPVDMIVFEARGLFASPDFILLDTDPLGFIAGAEKMLGRIGPSLLVRCSATEEAETVRWRLADHGYVAPPSVRVADDAHFVRAVGPDGRGYRATAAVGAEA